MATKDNLPLQGIIVAPQGSDQGTGANESAIGIIANDRLLAEEIDKKPSLVNGRLPSDVLPDNIITLNGTPAGKNITGNLAFLANNTPRGLSWGNKTIKGTSGVLEIDIPVAESFIVKSSGNDTFLIDSGKVLYNYEEVATKSEIIPITGNSRSNPITGDLYLDNSVSVIWGDSGTGIHGGRGYIDMLAGEEIMIGPGTIQVDTLFNKAYYSGTEIATLNDLPDMRYYVSKDDESYVSGSTNGSIGLSGSQSVNQLSRSRFCYVNGSSTNGAPTSGDGYLINCMRDSSTGSTYAGDAFQIFMPRGGTDLYVRAKYAQENAPWRKISTYSV